MKIFIVSHGAERAGAELSLVEIVRMLATRGHQCIVSLPSEGPIGPLMVELVGSDNVRYLKTRRWMGKRSAGLVGAVRLVQTLIDTLRFLSQIYRAGPDVLLVNTGVIPSPLLASKILNIPSMTMVRESIRTNGSLRSVLPKPWVCWLLSKLSTSVVVNSEYISVEYGYPCEVVYPSISVALSRNAPRSNVHYSNTDPLKIIMVGTISEEKGQLDLLRACESIISSSDAIDVRFYGHGSEVEESELLREIEVRGLSGFVRFMGSTSDVSTVYRSADISVVCSRNEAFGKVTAESILAGLPVVGYGCGGTAEILAHGGGLAIDPSSDALASALLFLAFDRRELDLLRAQCLNNTLVDQCLTSALRMCRLIETLEVQPIPGNRI